MEYVALLHKDKKSDIGVSFPDFPGCVTAGRNLHEAVRMAKEALAFHIRGMKKDRERIPAPSPFESVAHEAMKQQAMAVVISITPNDADVVRVNITARRSQLKEIDRRAAEAGLTRSSFIVRAATEEHVKVRHAGEEE